MRVRNRSTGRIIMARPGLNDPPWEAIDSHEDAPETPETGEVAPDTTPTPKKASTSLLACPDCGKEYKTERGYTNHIDTHA